MVSLPNRYVSLMPSTLCIKISKLVAGFSSCILKIAPAILHTQTSVPGYQRGQRAWFALTFLLDPCYHLGWPDGSPSAAGHPLRSEVSHTCASITNKQAPTDCRSRFSRCSTSYLPPGRSQNSKSKKTL